MNTFWTLFVFWSFGLLVFVESTFPKCEDILQTTDGKSPCWYCTTDRIGQECKDQCMSAGCSKDSSSSSDSSSKSESSSSSSKSESSSNSVSNDNSNSESSKSSSSSSDQQSSKDSDNSSGQSIKKSKGKGKAAKGKKPKKAKASKASKASKAAKGSSSKDSSSSSSSSSNSENSESSNSKSSGNSGSSGSSGSSGNSGSSGSSGSNGNSGSSGNSASSGSSGSSGATGQCDKLEPCVPLDEANKKFRACCVEKNLGDDCYDACRYDVTKKELVHKFLSKECQLAQSRDLLYCMADNKDNSFCCTKKGLLAGSLEVCEPFCNPASKDWPTKASAKYLKCLAEVDDIIKCHWASRTP